MLKAVPHCEFLIFCGYIKIHNMQAEGELNRKA